LRSRPSEVGSAFRSLKAASKLQSADFVDHVGARSFCCRAGGGSGWVILSYSPRDKRLVNQWAADHTTTLAGGRPVLVLDIYEHAYHTDYGAAAARYVDVFMEAIRWDTASKLFEQYSRESCGEPLAAGD